MKTIDLCIPAVGVGAHCLDFYLGNLLETAHYPGRLTISVTYHSPEDLAVIKGLKNAGFVKHFYHAPFYGLEKFFASANHSAAVNVLAENASQDIVIFSDYDMAFLKKGWDADIESILEKHDLFGVPYAPVELGFGKDPTEGLAPWLPNQKMMKYQGLPNLSFLAIKWPLLKSIIHDKPLTSFDQFLLKGDLPFRFINTHELAEELNMKLGQLNWMDTGNEIPSLVKRLALKCKVLNYVFPANADVFTHKFLLPSLKPILHPEFFYLDNDPFLFHFKKGSMKSKLGGDANFFDYFKLDVNNYLKANHAHR